MKFDFKKLILNGVIMCFIFMGMWVSYLGAKTIILRLAWDVSSFIGLFLMFLGTMFSGIGIACLIIKNPGDYVEEKEEL